MTAVSVGPFAFPVPVALVALALAVMLLTAWLADRRQGSQVETIVWQAALAALLVGRGVFVLQYIQVYARQPLGMLDLRDGGFSAGAGLFTATLVLAWHVWRHAASRRGLLLTAVAGASATGIAYAVLQLSFPPPRQLDNVPMTTLNGDTVSTDDFHGKPTVINLWASWCPPCRREMPAFQEGQANNPDIRFVFANQQESADIVQNWLDAEGLDLDNVLLDASGRLADNVGSRGLPTTLFLDEQGRLVTVRMGELSSATLQNHLNTLRAGADTGALRKD